MITKSIMEKKFKQGLTIRGDSLYCPLSFSLDSYSNCTTDCLHCYLRRLNEIWGKDLRPLDLEIFERTLHNGLKNPNPKSSLAWALKQKKTIRFGNKADPFQEAELTYKISGEVLEILKKYDWDVVIETKFTHILSNYEHTLREMNNIHIMPIVTVGLDKDWILFEKSKPTPPIERIKYIDVIHRFFGIDIGINGEPFIPGYHTIEQFEEMMKLLKRFQIPSYNTYNLHFNAFVAKRLYEAGIDIEKIWYYNQDEQWRLILQKLIDLSKKYDIRLGCPDFVNAGWSYMETANTCCGINVQNPCNFNAMNWKQRFQKRKHRPGKKNMFQDIILNNTWDGIGDFELGRQVMYGENKDIFTLLDIKD